MPINTAPADQWFVKWFTSGAVVPGGSATPDWTEFALVQTRQFSVNASGTTYSVPNMDLGAQGLTLSTPADTASQAPPISFAWNATSMTNNGYGWRIDSATDFQTNQCSIPSTGWTAGMLNATASSSNCSGMTAGNRFWRVGIEQITSGGITVVSSTRYWRITVQ